VALFLLIYLPGSIIIINDYFSRRDVYRKQTERLMQLEEETSAAKGTFDNAQRQIAVLQDYIVSLETPTPLPSEKPPPSRRRSRPLPPKRKSRSAQSRLISRKS
jgi:hypothetical protein